MEIIRSETTEVIREEDRLTVAMAQIAPVWLQRNATLKKVLETAHLAANQGCDLLVFGEALVPGYPFWLENTDGARFNDPKQKAIHAHYLDQGVVIERGDLKPLCDLAAQKSMAMYVGIMEKAPDRGSHSLYCSLVYIDKTGCIASVHRKLQPTYEERLSWAPGDGHGLVVHDLSAFKVGGLNCYENWMPLVRASLYAQGEDLHVSVWPGGLHNTQDIPFFIAKEARSYVIACSSLMRAEDFPAETLSLDEILANAPSVLANGGSTIIAPDGKAIIEPVVGIEALIIADIDHKKVREERQNFDVSGHYSRPDVTQLKVNRQRLSVAKFED
ncbi:carbon-nitrogen hydrolase family protein [Marinomonas agarivorans]|nr:carbon-nitrogen hydrolase family protein [Marinomonas agarivorans]